MSAGPYEVQENICRLTRVERTLYIQANTLYAGNNICWLECIKQGQIYVGQHTYSAHDISGPMHYMQLKDISQLRLAGMLYVHIWQVYFYAYSVKI